jgi:hypothetical protein
MDSGYGYNTDKILLQKNDIKQIYGEKEIFQIVFQHVNFDKKYLSPFRTDNTPSCYFIIGRNGNLLFCDWADIPRFRDCIQAIMETYNLTLNDSLLFIDRYFKSTPKYREEFKKKFVQDKAQNYPITFKSRRFIKKDMDYWGQFNITPIQLSNDKVYAINSFKMYSTKLNGFSYVDCSNELCYGYTEFNEVNHQKVYFPNRKKFKWFTNCNQNDIFNIRNIESTGKKLIITKSYKDCRIIRNSGYINTIAFQNEGMFPDHNILTDLILRFEDIYIFFDNDTGGINAATKLTKLIRELGGSFPHRILTPKNTKDIGEVIQNHGPKFTKQFLDETITRDFSSFMDVDTPY